MNRIKLLTSIVVLATFSIVACKKEDSQPQQPATACNGMNFCFKLDGTEESYNADWRKIDANANSPARYRIYWEEGTGNSYKNIEMDVYASTEGDYTVRASDSNNPYAANDAAFNYFFASDGRIIEGQSGTITISEIDNTNNTISGTFKISASDGNGTQEITEGNFVKVPLK